MNKLEIINAHIPICPECNAKMQVEVISSNIICHGCKVRYKILELGRNDRDLICERRETVQK